MVDTYMNIYIYILSSFIVNATAALQSEKHNPFSFKKKHSQSIHSKCSNSQNDSLNKTQTILLKTWHLGQCRASMIDIQNLPLSPQQS